MTWDEIMQAVAAKLSEDAPGRLPEDLICTFRDGGKAVTHTFPAVCPPPAGAPAQQPATPPPAVDCLLADCPVPRPQPAASRRTEAEPAGQAEQPAADPPPLPDLKRSEQTVMDLLDDAMRRMKAPEVVRALENHADEDRRFAERTVRGALARLVSLGLLNIRKDAYGDGYGVSAWA